MQSGALRAHAALLSLALTCGAARSAAQSIQFASPRATTVEDEDPAIRELGDGPGEGYAPRELVPLDVEGQLMFRSDAAESENFPLAPLVSGHVRGYPLNERWGRVTLGALLQLQSPPIAQGAEAVALRTLASGSAGSLSAEGRFEFGPPDNRHFGGDLQLGLGLRYQGGSFTEEACFTPTPDPSDPNPPLPECVDANATVGFFSLAPRVAIGGTFYGIYIGAEYTFNYVFDNTSPDAVEATVNEAHTLTIVGVLALRSDLFVRLAYTFPFRTSGGETPVDSFSNFTIGMATRFSPFSQGGPTETDEGDG